MATPNTHIRLVIGGSIVGGSCRCGLPECERAIRDAEARRNVIIEAQEAAFEDIHLPTKCVSAERLPLSLAIPLEALYAA